MTLKDESELQTQATKIGEKHGNNAASWIDHEDCLDVLRGFEEGDPAYTFVTPLAGQYAGDYSPQDLATELELAQHYEAMNDDDAMDHLDELCTAYEDGYWRGFTSHLYERLSDRQREILYANDYDYSDPRLLEADDNA